MNIFIVKLYAKVKRFGFVYKAIIWNNVDMWCYIFWILFYFNIETKNENNLCILLRLVAFCFKSMWRNQC